ncbi:PREDICTED: odorant receptor 67a-like isoform X2 [Vollenhovia emeryi]|uniref:odorant receptor 67a-like isoform X2 n=1 Tax=Vollenhovia emeryi TaxID=411798 RepID=UPI0005F38D54|nr:PREDICTED: odorant receptor 67a-like isoform X2 [Vollenhovia emeryi]
MLKLTVYVGNVNFAFVIIAVGDKRDGMDDIEQFFKDRHYNIARILLSICGVWPFNTRNRRYIIYFAMTLMLGSAFIFEILGIIDIRHDSVEIIDAVPMICFTILCASKMFCAVHTLPQIKVLLIKMQEYCLSPKSDEETKIQNSHAEYGRKLSYAYTGFILSHSVVYLLSTLLARLVYMKSEKIDETSNAQIGLPHRVNYIIDLDTYYVPIFIHCAICDFTLTFLLVVFDVLYLIVVEHCCGLFAALRYRLEIALVFEKEQLSTTKDKSYSNIVYSIRRHVETMQFVAIMESVYSLSLSIHIGMTVFLISFLGYQGQKIIDSSERVFESAYNSEWYSMPISARKLLIMMMKRSEKPSILRMSKLVVLSYVTFNTVLRTSLSYFMLLRSL